MITNLLDKTVVPYDTNIVGRICSIKDNLEVVFVSQDGVFHVTNLVHLRLHENRDYYVCFTWQPDTRIRAIKTLREIANLDLKEARDFVDNHSYRLKAKENLTYDEALRTKQQIESNGFKAEILQKD